MTIGELERRAGIGPSHAERLAFWMQFASLKDGAFTAAVAELDRRIAEKEAHNEQICDNPQPRRK